MARKVGLARVFVLFLLFGLCAGSQWRYSVVSPQTAPEPFPLISQYPCSPCSINDPQPAQGFKKTPYPVLKLQPHLIPLLLPPGVDLGNLFKPQLLPFHGSRIGPNPNLYPPPGSLSFAKPQPLFLQGTDPGYRPLIGTYPRFFAFPKSHPFVEPEQLPSLNLDQGLANGPYLGPYPRPFPPSEARPFFDLAPLPLQGTERLPENRPFLGPYPIPFPSPEYRPFAQPEPLPLQGTDNLLQNRPFLGPYPRPFPPSESRSILHLEVLAKEDTDEPQEIHTNVNGLSSKPSHTHPKPNLNQDAPQLPELPPQSETDLASDSPLFTETGQDSPSHSGAISITSSGQSTFPTPSDQLPQSFARVKHADGIMEKTLSSESGESPSSDLESAEMEPRVLIDTWRTQPCPDGQKRDHAGRCREVSF